ncbi:MAG: dTDP-4-dehydrorhamnose 3,5-epimerase family protein [Candidatus Woesearchaeota archaeon]|jgi:dTDP-4-dehydrorhamnose 3,5-epimerase|nr:dTDP-4-dehydrorhamnose 3,5-epimerase family protein [Candidatus Woesearchaeota archaeon]
METKIPIEGAKVIKLKINKDERGNFIELLRQDQKLMNGIEQISISTTNPGVIKAFHFHKNQTDIWYVVEGKAYVGLYDNRENSKTKGEKFELILENKEDERVILVIPKGIAHGYKAVGDKPLTMLYMMDKCYNPSEPDELRIPHDDPNIAFDWAKHD